MASALVVEADFGREWPASGVIAVPNGAESALKSRLRRGTWSTRALSARRRPRPGRVLRPGGIASDAGSVEPTTQGVDSGSSESAREAIWNVSRRHALGARIWRDRDVTTGAAAPRSLVAGSVPVVERAVHGRPAPVLFLERLGIG